MPGVIMMAALLALFVLEVVLKSKTGGHSHGGPTGEKIAISQPQFGMAAQAAPMGVSVAPAYRPGTAVSDNAFYPDEKTSPYVRLVILTLLHL